MVNTNPRGEKCNIPPGAPGASSRGPRGPRAEAPDPGLDDELRALVARERRDVHLGPAPIAGIRTHEGGRCFLTYIEKSPLLPPKKCLFPGGTEAQMATAKKTLKKNVSLEQIKLKEKIKHLLSSS